MILAGKGQKAGGKLGKLGKLGKQRRSDKTSFVGAGFTTNVSFSP